MDGSLIFTTPNPFAPWRARAGQLGVAWENADHLCYIFPSGVIEMAGRTGFRVDEITTEKQPDNTRTVRSSARALVMGAGRRVLRKGGDSPAKNTLQVPLPRTYLNPLEFLLLRNRRRFGQCGERAIYRLTYVGLGSSDT